MRWRLALLVPAGMVVGHTLGYVLALPDASEHAAAMAAHGHLPSLAGAGAVAGLTAMLLSAVRRAGRPGPRGLGTLVAMQTTAFVGLEFVEALVAGSVWHGPWTARAVGCGLLAQLLTAAALLLAQRAAHRAGQLVEILSAPAAVARTHRLIRHLADRPAEPSIRRRLLTPLTRRGPPQPLIGC